MQHGLSKAAGEELSDGSAAEVRFTLTSQRVSGPRDWMTSPLVGTENTLALALFWEPDAAGSRLRSIVPLRNHSLQHFLPLQYKILPELIHAEVPRVSYNWPNFIDPRVTPLVNRET